MSTLPAKAARAIIHRSGVVAIGLLAVTVALGFGLPRLEFETSQASLVSPDTEVYQLNQRYQEQFGGEPMLVLFTGEVTSLFEGDNFEAIESLESELRAAERFDAVLGPLTALEFAEAQLSVAPAMILDAAERHPNRADALYAALGAEATRLGSAGEHVLTNPAFVDFLLFDAGGEIRPALGDNFPDSGNALLIVRLAGNASIAQQAEDAELVRDIVARHDFEGFDVVATGPSVLLAEINDYLQGGMATLGAIAAVVMVVLLFLVFRARWPLLSLAAVSVGLVWAFGALGYLGIPLTMVTISGLPILLGLGVDFAIQVHNRIEEELGHQAGAEYALARTFERMAPTLLVAMMAAIAGFLALQLSAVPMIKDFGVLLSVGMVTLVFAALSIIGLLIVWREQHRPARHVRAAGGRWSSAMQWLTGLRSRRALAIVAVGACAAAAGFAVDGRIPIETDPEAWVASDSPAVAELEALREGTGYSSELGFLIEADDVTSTEVASWMQTYVEEQLATHPGQLVRGTSLAAIAASVTGLPPVAADMMAVESVAPADVVTAFVSTDHRRANLIFPVAPLSLDDRRALLADMTAALDPPPGVQAEPSGLVVIGIELVDALEHNRQVLTAAALGLVGLWLLIAYRRVSLAIVPLVPVALAVGIAVLAVYALGLELTPLTMVSGPLAIAIATEFSVLMLSRYREERTHGTAPAAAVSTAATRIGRAFVASGLTLLGGFAVLALSPMPLLRDFGIVVAIAVTAALLGVLVVLPPLLVWADRWFGPPPVDDHYIDLTRRRVEEAAAKETLTHG